jgi:hypothetical protein
VIEDFCIRLRVEEGESRWRSFLNEFGFVKCGAGLKFVKFMDTNQNEVRVFVDT